MSALFDKHPLAEPGSYLVRCRHCGTVADMLDFDGLGGGEEFLFCPHCGKKTPNETRPPAADPD